MVAKMVVLTWDYSRYSKEKRLKTSADRSYSMGKGRKEEVVEIVPIMDLEELSHICLISLSEEYL